MVNCSGESEKPAPINPVEAMLPELIKSRDSWATELAEDIASSDVGMREFALVSAGLIMRGIGGPDGIPLIDHLGLLGLSVVAEKIEELKKKGN